MTITQIQAFLEVARCKNISEAAKRLYITQPALGRQLTAIERELNMQLLIRSNRGVRLTPAGVVLQRELELAMKHVKKGIDEAKATSYGYSGELTIGVLEELNVIAELADMIEYFEQHYPNIRILLKRRSFGGLVEGIYDGSLDAVLSLSLNFFDCKGMNLRRIRSCVPAFAVPAAHPLAQKATLHFRDFKGIPLVVVDRTDCASGVKFVEETFMKEAGFCPEFYFTTSQKDVMSWVEAGKKCAVINMDMMVANSKYVKMYPFEEVRDFSIQMASNAENEKYELHLLNQYFADVYDPKKYEFSMPEQNVL